MDNAISKLNEYIDVLKNYKNIPEDCSLASEEELFDLLNEIHYYVTGNSRLKEEVYNRINYFKNYQNDESLKTLLKNLDDLLSKNIIPLIDFQKSDKYREEKIFQVINKIISEFEHRAKNLDERDEEHWSAFKNSASKPHKKIKTKQNLKTACSLVSSFVFDSNNVELSDYTKTKLNSFLIEYQDTFLFWNKELEDNITDYKNENIIYSVNDAFNEILSYLPKIELLVDTESAEKFYESYFNVIKFFKRLIDLNFVTNKNIPIINDYLDKCSQSLEELREIIIKIPNALKIKYFKRFLSEISDFTNCKKKITEADFVLKELKDNIEQKILAEVNLNTKEDNIHESQKIFVLNRNLRMLTLYGIIINLTPKEFLILEKLASNPNICIYYNEFANHFHTNNSLYFRNSLAQHKKNLINKIKNNLIENSIFDKQYSIIETQAKDGFLLNIKHKEIQII